MKKLNSNNNPKSKLRKKSNKNNKLKDFARKNLLNILI
jgi:hypothetical protein